MSPKSLALAKKDFGTAFCVRFRRLADFYSKDFSLGTLYYQIVVLILEIRRTH